MPEAVTVEIAPGRVAVKGPKGELDQRFSPDMKVEQADGTVTVERPTDRGEHRALHGLTRSLIANMVEGVTKRLREETRDPGRRLPRPAQGQEPGDGARLLAPGLGRAAGGIEFEVPQPTEIVVRGIDKQLVGQVAADIRKRRPPEPYKGKGIRYRGEHVARKVGKRA